MATLSVNPPDITAASASIMTAAGTPELGTVVTPQAGDLLAALVGFIQPVMHAYSPSASFPPSGDNWVANAVAGQKLISALTEFIAETVCPDKPKQSKIVDAKEKQGIVSKSVDSMPFSVVWSDDNEDHLPMTANSNLDVHRPHARLRRGQSPLVNAELEQRILTTAREHVFNKMPIRLLAFDSTGAKIQLITRDEILSRILPAIYAGLTVPEFEQAGNEAYARRNFGFLGKRYKDRLTASIQEVIERSARYAILSHTWIRESPGDVVYRDWETRDRNPRGDAKIVKFCEVAARNHDVTLGWIDSVCINKDSSTELDESIRSMYKWYRGAYVCVTYLYETRYIKGGHHDSWFTRGWTLQELLAPVHSCFYSTEWEILGHGNEPEIQWLINSETRITKQELDLCRSGEMEKIPLSRRLEMASKRQVTREEDISYALMGILGVNISIAYGEGSQRAFSRLFRELLNTKKHVLDLFNRKYDRNTLIPPSIELYSGRTNRFDTLEGPTGSTLDEYPPMEPILMTHIGVRIPLILAPALLADPNQDNKYIPRGDFSGEYIGLARVFFIPNLYLYNILDCRLFSDNDSTFTETVKTNTTTGELVKMLGIFNFGVQNGDILLPKHCTAFSLMCGDIRPGQMGPSSVINIEAISPPPTFDLKSAKNAYNIPKNELGKHGFQLETFYL